MTGPDLTRQTGPVHWHAPGEPPHVYVGSTGDGEDTDQQQQEDCP